LVIAIGWFVSFGLLGRFMVRCYFKYFGRGIEMESTVLEALLKKQAAIAERVKRLKSKAEAQKRKDDLRKQVLVGAYFLQQHEIDGTFDKLVNQLDSSLKNPKDRKLFGLMVVEET
jgi:Tfp pilus assembly protein PilN